MIATDEIREGFKFFHEWGGGIVGEQAVAALAEARAEAVLRHAIEGGRAEVRWEIDDDPYDIDDQGETFLAFERGEIVGPFGCVLEVDGGHVSSLWGITLNAHGNFGRYGTSDGSDTLGDGWSPDPYARVIEAELALEALEALLAPVSSRPTVAPLVGNVIA